MVEKKFWNQLNHNLINMKNCATVIAMLMVLLASCSKENNAKSNKDYLVTISTTYGDMKVILFDETPLHKANFLKLAQDHEYDSTIWHRVIEGFMIQGGGIDIKSGSNETRKLIDAEILPNHIHRKGALAAARTGDHINPEKKSSWCQFYIVQGEVYDSAQLKSFEEQTNQSKKGRLFNEIIRRPENAHILGAGQEYQRENNQEKLDSLMNHVMEMVDRELVPLEYSNLQVEAYTTIGGTPHLDKEYTVFGQVIDGMDVIDRIAGVEKGSGDKPKVDLFLTMEVEQLSKKKITKLYGYEYPE